MSKTKIPIKIWAEDLNGHYPKEDIQMANRHMIWFSILLVLRSANQNHSEISHHTWLWPKNLQITCWQGCREKKTLVVHSWWDCISSKTQWKNSMKVPQKTENRATIWYSTLLLSLYLKKIKTQIQKATCILEFTAASLKIAKMWEQPKCPSTEERMKLLLLLSHFSCVRLCAIQ